MVGTNAGSFPPMGTRDALGQHPLTTMHEVIPERCSIAGLVASADGAALLQSFVWLVGVVLAILLGVVLLSFIHDWMVATRETVEPCFTVEDLCRFRERGDWTIEEYEEFKRRAL